MCLRFELAPGTLKEGLRHPYVENFGGPVGHSVTHYLVYFATIKGVSAPPYAHLCEIFKLYHRNRNNML